VKPIMPGPALPRILCFAVERKRAEQALCNSEAMFRKLHESLMDGFIRVDMEGRIMESNSPFQLMVGYSEEELLSMTDMQLTPERWIDYEAGVVAEQIIPRGYSDLYEKEYRVKSGEIVPVELRASLLRDESGAPTGMWAIVRDLTERKRADKELSASEARLANAIKTAGLGHWDFDVINDVFTFSDHFYAVMRTTAEREGGYFMTSAQYVDRFVYPEDRTMIRAQLKANRETISSHPAGWVEHRMLYADGEIGYVAVRFFAVTDDQGRIIKTSGVNQDITERKRMEEALRISEAQYRLIANNTTDVIWLFDLALDHFTYISPSVEKLWGYNVEEALSRKMPDVLMPESYRMLTKDLHQYIAAFKSGDDSVRAQTYELEQLRKDGSIVTTETVVTLIPDGNRNVGQIQGISRNITERKLLQRQLLQAQKMEAVGRLAGGIAHDFNNLLTIILGYSETLLESPSLDAVAREELELIRKAGSRAAALTSKLLAFSRKQILQLKVVNLKTLIPDSLKLLRRLIGEDVVIITDLAPDLGFVKADTTQIDQVIMNLAINSRDAMPQGGKLVLEAANIKLDQAFVSNHIGARTGEHIVLSISDTGTGMNAETKSHLFEPFYTTKEMGKGTGLGLSTVYGIVSRSGGFIAVDSELGQGTTFRIYLPRVNGSLDHAQTREVIPSNGSETILIVEDDDNLRMLISRLLKEKGYTVLAADSGPSGISVAAQHDGMIHLLITDMIMPGGMNGLTVSNLIHGYHPKIKVLVITGYTGGLETEAALDLDMPMLQKPFAAGDLLHRVREILGEKIDLTANTWGDPLALPVRQ
jgi:PAS domain S-box-containing protein